MIGIIAALERELEPLIEKMEGASSQTMLAWEVWRGRLGSLDVVASFSRCGKVRAAALTQFVITQFKPVFIIHYGTAGGISPEARPGDIIIGEKSIEVDYLERMIPDYPRPEARPDPRLLETLTSALTSEGLPFRVRPIVCQDTDIVDPEVKKALWSRYRGECACWEGVAVGRVCNLNGVAYVQLRGITDLADCPDKVAEDFGARVADVSGRLSEYVVTVLPHMLSSLT